MVLITVPEVLRDRLGADGAQALVELLDRALGRTRDDFALVLDTRMESFERRLQLFEERLDGRLEELDRKFEAGLEELDRRVEARLENLEDKLEARLESRLSVLDEKFERRLAEETGKLKTSLLGWMFLFWATQLTALGGAVFALLRFIRI